MNKSEAFKNSVKEILPLPGKKLFEALEKSILFGDFCQAFLVPREIAEKLRILSDTLCQEQPQLEPRKTHSVYPRKILFLAAENNQVFNKDQLTALRQTIIFLDHSQKPCSRGKKLAGLIITPETIDANYKRSAELKNTVWSKENIVKFNQWLEDYQS